MSKGTNETTVHTGQILTPKVKKIALSALFVLAVLITQFIFRGVSRDTVVYKEYQHAKRMKREANDNLNLLEKHGCCDKRCYSLISRIEKLNSMKTNTDLKSIFLRMFDEMDKLTREINVLKNDCFKRDFMETAPSMSKSYLTHDTLSTGPGEEVSTGQQLTLVEPRQKLMNVPTAIASANPYYQPTHEGRLIPQEVNRDFYPNPRPNERNHDFYPNPHPNERNTDIYPNPHPNERNPRFYCSYIPTTYPVVEGVSHIDQYAGRSSSYTKGYNDLEQLYLKDTFHGLTQNCADRTQKIDIISMCNNQVDCSDASDEVGCSCKDRVSKRKHCDGFFDCPNGEDEVGCGCHLNEFSCNDQNYHSTCLPIDKRCDGTVDCPNGIDEFDCSLIKNTIGHDPVEPFVSYGEGFLHRNWKGHWYPVCSNESFAHLSHMACVSEFGTLSSPMLVKLRSFKETYTGLFVIENPIKGLTFVKECDSGKASWVQCPITECGIKSQMKLSNEDSIRRFKRYMETTGFYGVEESKNGRDFIKFCPSATKSSESNFRLTNPRKYYRMRRSLKTKIDKREEPRIVGGTKSGPGAWPWVVAIHKDGIYYCGGVIISPDYVLTAAHCMQGYDSSYYEVRAGLLRRFSYSPQEQMRIVKDIIIHEDFNGNDIAILQVNESFMFNRWVLASCLPNQGIHDVPQPNSKCIAVGWGATKEQGKDPDVMHQVELKIFSHCKNTVDREANDLCAGYEIGGKDSCQGDSGSPLLCKNDEDDKWYIAGIVSHGKGCGRTGEQGIYTRVSKYSDWIMETTKSKDNFNMMNIKPRLDCPGYQCHNDKCIPQAFKCNGVIDCLFGDDEVKCQRRIAPNTKPIVMPNYLPQVIDITSVGAKTTRKNGEETTIEKNSDVKQNITKTTESEENNSTEILLNFKITEAANTTANESSDIQNLSVEDRLQTEDGQTFKCKKITQIIFKNRVCDGIADCIDLSDELGCNCKDKLMTTNPDLLCDGKIDCYDMTDEKSCQYKCKDFQCKKSDKCIPIEKKCDGINDCPEGEDEEFCYVLLDKDAIKSYSKGSNSFIDKSKRPWLKETGFPYYLQGNTWRPYCAQKSEYLKAALEICNKLGFRHVDVLSKIYVGKCFVLELNCTSYYMIEKQPWRAVVHHQNKILGLGVLINPSWILSSFSTQYRAEINVKLGYIEVTNEVVGIHEQNIGVYDMGFISNGHLENSVILLRLKKDTFLSHDVIPVGLYGKSLEIKFYNCNCQAVGLDKNKNEKRIDLKLKNLCEPGWNCFSSSNNCENNNGLLTNGFVTCESPGYGVSLVSLFDRLQCPDDICYNKMSEIKLRDVRTLQHSIDSLISGSDKHKRNHNIEDNCETIRCEWGNCLSWDLINNGMDDCANGDDESHILAQKKLEYCNSTKCDCQPGTFSCSSNNSKICLDLSKFCDGNPDCPDGSDESSKCGSCKHYLSQVSPGAICDGHLNCEDRTDEENCEKLYDCSSPDFFKCSRSKMCVPNELVCDNEIDCYFGEDEKDCFGLSVQHQKSSKYFGLLSQKIHGEMVPLCISENPPQNLTLNLCKEFGYDNATPNVELMEKVMLIKDSFSEVVLSNITTYNVRSSRPLVRSVINGTCPVMFISCY